mmetsp:Transcript_25713/g.39539  ORF Transcript_25713/g.39539 Transcript_25713/m.39539 type:complete len:113 (+) Transcript_25713:604-942(+)
MKAIDRIITESLKRGLVNKTDLAKSFVTYDLNKRMYVQKKLNVPMVQVRKNQAKFNAAQIINRYNKAYALENTGRKRASMKIREGLGVSISQIHLSSKDQYEQQDGTSRMDR